MALYTIKLRRGIASDWTAINPVLDEGEFGYELDTRNFKIGDGSLHWVDLQYVIDENDRLPDASLIDDGQILITEAGEWTFTDLSAVTGIPLTAKGDLLTFSTAESSEEILISNADPFSYITIPGTADEVLVPGAVVDLAAVGDSVLITGTFAYSQDDPGVSKRVRVRVRRDGLSGAELGYSADDSSLDSTIGSGESWTISITDNTPTTGKYVITVQPWPGYSISNIYTQTHLIEADTNVVTTAGLMAVPVSGLDGRILTEDSSLDAGFGWADAPSGLPDPTGEADGRVLVVLDDDWVVGDAAVPGDTNTDTRVYPGGVNGALVMATGTTRIYNDTGRTLTILNIRASVGTAPVGGPIVIDVNKNGTSLFPTGTKPTIASGAVTDKRVPATTSFADGDYLTVDVDAVGTTIAGSNLNVQIEVSG